MHAGSSTAAWIAVSTMPLRAESSNAIDADWWPPLPAYAS